MKKPVIKYTDLEISDRLAFAKMLIQQLLDRKRPPVLSPHLEVELQELLVEQSRRLIGVNGEGI